MASSSTTTTSSSSSSRLLAAAVLLSVLAAASGSFESCVPGWGIPHNALPSCRRYVRSRVCGYGPRLPLPELKRRCCAELEDIADYCRCTALSYFIDGVIPPGPGKQQMEGRLEELPGCPREVQRRFGAALVSEAECNLGTISGMGGCSWILDYDPSMPSK